MNTQGYSFCTMLIHFSRSSFLSQKREHFYVPVSGRCWNRNCPSYHKVGVRFPCLIPTRLANTSYAYSTHYACRGCSMTPPLLTSRGELGGTPMTMMHHEPWHSICQHVSMALTMLYHEPCKSFVACTMGVPSASYEFVWQDYALFPYRDILTR